MKISRLERILRLLMIVQSGGYYSPSELSQKLKVSKRTVFRDLDILYKVGIPCYYDENEGGYKLDDKCFFPPLNMKMKEVLPFLLAARHTGGAMGIPLLDSAQEAAMKIANVLPNHIKQYCTRIRALSSYLDRSV